MLTITAYHVKYGTTMGYSAIAGTSGDYVPAGTLIFNDALFQELQTTATDDQWVYEDTGPTVTEISYNRIDYGFRYQQVYYALKHQQSPYLLMHGQHTLRYWYYNDQFYQQSTAPDTEAFELSRYDYFQLLYWRAQGYSIISNNGSPEPVVVSEWTQPVVKHNAPFGHGFYTLKASRSDNSSFPNALMNQNSFSTWSITSNATGNHLTLSCPYPLCATRLKLFAWQRLDQSSIREGCLYGGFHEDAIDTLLLSWTNGGNSFVKTFTNSTYFYFYKIDILKGGSVNDQVQLTTFELTAKRSLFSF